MHQFDQLVHDATIEVRNKGLNASQQAVMFFGLGHLDQRLSGRVVPLNGKTMMSVASLIGVAIGTLIGRVL